MAFIENGASLGRVRNLSKHLTYFDRSSRKAMYRNWSNQKANNALKTKTGNK